MADPADGPFLSAEHQELKRAARAFGETLGKDIVERDRSERFSREDWKRCAEFGVLRVPIPIDSGGQGGDAMAVVAVMEGLGHGCCDQGLLFAINAHLWTCATPLVQFGTEAQRQAYLEPLCDGSMIGANGASEPEAGSDIYSLRTKADRDGDFFVLNGTKTFTSNAPVADLFVIYATIDQSYGVHGITAFVVPRNTEGLRIGGTISKMGLRTAPMSEVVLDNVRVPSGAVLGRVGRGAEVFEYSMTRERASILACTLGVMERRLEECIAYVRQRKQFGQPIGRFQLVASHIVDMKLRLETSRFLIYNAARQELHGSDRDKRLAAAMVKLHVSDCYVRSSLDAIQVHGGYGYTTEFGIERELRDAVGSSLYSGTSEIQRTIIAKELGVS